MLAMCRDAETVEIHRVNGLLYSKKEALVGDDEQRFCTRFHTCHRLNHILVKRARGRGRTNESSVEIEKPLTRLEKRRVIESPNRSNLDVATSTAQR